MARPVGTKYIETPEKLWELDLPKNQYGNYIVVPKKREYSGITKNNKEKNWWSYSDFDWCDMCISLRS